MKPEISTCFVIAPVPDDASNTRKETDKLLWAIRNVALKHSFSVTTSREAGGLSVITDEIRDLVIKSGLCVSILTENDPNVFYVTGLRHGAAKPYVHLMRRGSAVPFGRKSDSAVFYGDLDSFEEMMSLTESLEALFAAQKEKAAELEHREKLDIILDVLEEMSAKMDGLKLGAPSPWGGAEPEPSLEGDPTEAFLVAVARADVSAAERLFEKALPMLVASRQRLAAARKLANIGSAVGIDYVLQHYREDPDLSPADTCALLSGLVEHVGGKFPEKIGAVIAILDPIAMSEDASVSILALNQKQRLAYAAGRYEEAMEIIESVLGMVDDNPAYYYNASRIYEKLNLFQKARAAVQKMLALGTMTDENHLSQAIDVYLETNDLDKARELYALLKKHAPRKAANKALDGEFRRKIGLLKR